MDSFVKLFRKKAASSKQQTSSSTDPQMAEMIQTNPNTRMIMQHYGKQQHRTSFRMPLHRRNSPPESADAGGDNGQNNGAENPGGQFPFKSPYSVLTEPKSGRGGTRSCPGAGPQRHRPRHFRKFSPQFGTNNNDGRATTIHELSGSYENFTSAEQPEKGKAEKVGPRGDDDDGGGQMRKKQLHRQQQIMVNGKSQAPRTVRCPPLGHSQQPPIMSTSEYGSADPSPISEQHHPHHQLQSQFPFSTQRRALAGGNLIEEDEEESSSDDGDNSSDDQQEISPAALIHFWQHQTRMLKKELKTCREAAEKYRNKYLRLKSRADELNMELAKERERNTWLFNQLMTTNEKMAQLSWAHLHNSQQQQQQQQQSSINTSDAREKKGHSQSQQSQRQHPFSLNIANGNDQPRMNPFVAMMKAYKMLDKCNNNDLNGHGRQHCSAAGEVQADLSSDDYGEDHRVDGEAGTGDSSIEAQMGGGSKHDQLQPQKILRTPTPIQPSDAPNGFVSAFGAPGTPFLNFNLFGPSHQQQQFPMEVPRGGGGNFLNCSQNSQSRLISPPLLLNNKIAKDGEGKLANQSEIIVEDDEDEEQMEAEEDGDSDSVQIGDGDSAALLDDNSIVIPLDAFCTNGYGGKRTKSHKGTHTKIGKLVRRSHSSDDLCALENNIGRMSLAVLSSSEDDIRMWKKQLRHRGDRVLFRPPRKHLFLGSAGAEKAAQKLFRRFGQPEREALSKFDYLRDERTDVSGLMSSPEKATPKQEQAK